MGAATSYVFLVTLLSCISYSLQVNHAVPTLLWTQKSFGYGEVSINGVPGDPEVWLRSDNEADYRPSTHAVPADLRIRYKAQRMALGFSYKTQDLFFSDRGFKEIYKLHILNMTGNSRNYTYNVTLESVYTGTSNSVYGIAVDWLTGMLYWTDGVYKWISVADAFKTNVYRHLIYTDMERPMGIAVHPHKGYLFWNDYGSMPRIERSMLDGTDRRVIFNMQGNSKPIGMTIDYSGGLLYWVDDAKDTIEWLDFDGNNHGAFDVAAATGERPMLYGITIYKSYVFVTDQFSMSIQAFNVSDSMKQVKRIQLTLGKPLDIMMYDESLQLDGPPDPCVAMACDHLCLGKGTGVLTCQCKQGYTLQEDGKTCVAQAFTKPLFIYTLGDELCSAPVNMVDRPHIPVSADVNCFLEGLGHVQALAFNVYEEMLYMSDTATRAIYKLRMDVPGQTPEIIVANTGIVRGIAVDYISDNLYWVDELHKHIMVSRLDGSYPRVLLNNMEDLRGLDIDAVNRTLYWTTPTAIMMSNLDGSNVRVFNEKDVRNADGLSVDSAAKKVYWTDHLTRTISVRDMIIDDQRRIFYSTPDEKGMRDVTVFHSYIMWTDGANAVFIGRVDQASSGALQAFNHQDKNVSHDVVVYDEYLQPLASGPCDVDNGGCEQLCLPTPTSRQCACAAGYTLLANGQCHSYIVEEDFVLMLDLYHKSLYQLSLKQDSSEEPTVQAVAMKTAAKPRYIAFDDRTQEVYWYDEAEGGVIRKDELSSGMESTVTILTHDARVQGLSLDAKSRRLFFSDREHIFVIDLDTGRVTNFYQAGPGDSILENSIDVNPADKSVYWMEMQNSQPMLARRPLDGSNPIIQLHRASTAAAPIQGMVVDHHNDSVYYWTNNTVFRCGTDGSDVTQVLSLPTDTILSLDAIDGVLYFSIPERNALFRMTVGDPSSVTAITPPMFSQLVAIMVQKPWTPPPTQHPPPATTTSSPSSSLPSSSSSSTASTRSSATTTTTRSSAATTTKSSAATTTTTAATPDEPTTRASNRGGNARVGASEKAGGVALLPLIVGVCLAFLILVITFGIICWWMKGRGGRKRRPRTVAYNPDAHDNPVYMSHGQAVSRGRSIEEEGGATGGGGAESVEEAPPIPDKKELPDDFLEVPPASPTQPLPPLPIHALEELGEEDDEGYMVPVGQDKSQLVKQEEVVLQIGENQGSVAFQNNSSNN